MKPYSSTYLKTHFGAVMDRESLEPVRIERRGRKPAVLIPESKYQELQGNALSGERESESALARLHSTATISKNHPCQKLVRNIFKKAIQA